MTRDGMRLAHWAKTQPDVLAVQSSSGDRTFAALNANSNRLARALRARGMKAGDGVAIVCGNRPEFAEAVHACPVLHQPGDAVSGQRRAGQAVDLKADEGRSREDRSRGELPDRDRVEKLGAR